MKPTRHPGILCLLLLGGSASAGEVLFGDDFESGLDRWRLSGPSSARIRPEPGTGNRVLELTPQTGGFSHAVIAHWPHRGNFRMEGRFQFPTQGDGYLGLIYNYREHDERTDFGCLYVKSNGSYLRASPHYDGNPSWRLYESYRVDLAGREQIASGTWYSFRLDVRGKEARLTVGASPAATLAFGPAPNSSGTFGLEARPGRGEPVWVDDLRISRLGHDGDIAAAGPMAQPDPARDAWEYYGPLSPAADTAVASPPDHGWQRLLPDARGALITGAISQFRSGDKTMLYLRTRFDAGDTPQPGWLAVSSANRVEVWLNGEFLATLEPQDFIWADHATNPEHRGHRLPLMPSAGRNDILLRVHGDRFAGGGLFIERSAEQRSNGI